MSLGPELEDLFASAREALAPTDADRARNFAALVDELGPAAAEAPAHGTRADGAPVRAETGLSISAKAALAGLAAVTILGASLGVFVTRTSGFVDSDESRTDPAVSMTAPDVAAPPEAPLGNRLSEPATNEPIEPPLPPTEGTDAPPDELSRLPHGPTKAPLKTKTSRATTTSTDAVATAKKQQLREEIDLVSRMQAALQRGDSDGVHALAREHARRFPEGALLPEAFATETMASCMTSPASAPGFVRRFQSRFPRSPLLARVRSACGE